MSAIEPSLENNPTQTGDAGAPTPEQLAEAEEEFLNHFMFGKGGEAEELIWEMLEEDG